MLGVLKNKRKIIERVRVPYDDGESAMIEDKKKASKQLW